MESTGFKGDITPEQMNTWLSAKVTPIFNNVLVRVLVQSKTKAGIHLPDNAMRVKDTRMGLVLAVGPGRTTDQGSLIPIPCAVGDVVYLPAFGGYNASVGGEELLMIRDIDLMGVVFDPDFPEPFSTPPKKAR